MGFTKKEAPPCEPCRFKADCFYAILDRKAKRDWVEMRVANRFKKEDIVFFDGEKPTGIYVLCSGKAKIYKSTRTGQQLITRIHKPGDLIGYRTVLAEQNYTGTAMAMEESVVSVIETDDFMRFLETNPHTNRPFLKKMARELGESENRARDIAYKPARARLSDVLLRLMHVNGKPKPTVTGVKRKEIAEMAGLTIETTVRLLQDFEKQGIVKRAEKSIDILQPERLKTISGTPA